MQHCPKCLNIISSSVIHIIIKITYSVNKIYKWGYYSDLQRKSAITLSLPFICYRLRLFAWRGRLRRNNLWFLFFHFINPFPNKPWFLHVCSSSLSKTLWIKEKLLYTFEELCSIFINFLKLCLQTPSDWKGLKFVVWERVKKSERIMISEDSQRGMKHKFQRLSYFV